MTEIRGVLLSNKMFERIVEKLNLAEFILMSKGEHKDFDAHKGARPYILADMFEALVGALYLDRGMGTVEIFLDVHLFSKIGEIVLENQLISAKSKLQELAQGRLRVTPHYDILFEQGADHNKVFTAISLIGDRMVGRGEWTSKAGAESAAARDALEREFGITLSDKPLLT